MNTKDPKMEQHRIDAEIENAKWLMGECGLTLAQAANRLGVSETSLERLLARHR
jgi:DNA-binding transcriptional regulator LsrR (DeoR family)